MTLAISGESTPSSVSASRPEPAPSTWVSLPRTCAGVSAEALFPWRPWGPGRPRRALLAFQFRQKSPIDLGLERPPRSSVSSDDWTKNETGRLSQVPGAAAKRRLVGSRNQRALRHWNGHEARPRRPRRSRQSLTQSGLARHLSFDRAYFPNMDEVDLIWKNGEFVPWEDAQTHVLSHGLHYGTGVFEGIRCYETERGPAIFRHADHLDRLREVGRALLHGAALLGRGDPPRRRTSC